MARPVRGQDSPPDMLVASELGIEIAGEQFVAEIQGVNSTLSNNSSEYRILVLTLKITKSAGLPLTLEAPDWVLHYYYENGTDVAPCQGVSYFSTMAGADRPMRVGNREKSSTQAATTASDEVYVDLLFGGMEASTGQMHLLLAQPIGASFNSNGYRP